jgi:FMN-dependent NADH-azoreductase
VKLLHIIASPHGEKSTTLRVSQAFVDRLRARRKDVTVAVVDLYNQDIPAFAGDNIEDKHALTVGRSVERSHAESWRQIEALMQRFLAADAYVISSPVWNLSIPYALKYYIDCVVQPGHAFKHNELGELVPLVLGKKMIVVTSRGGDSGSSSQMHARSLDYQEPYLRAIFGLIGITDVEFIHALPADIGLERAKALASRPDWLALATTATEHIANAV